jgi:hypothetical protein
MRSFLLKHSAHKVLFPEKPRNLARRLEMGVQTMTEVFPSASG